MPSLFVARPPQFSGGLGTIMVIAGAALLGGCANLPSAETGPRPFDPDVRVPVLAYQSVTAGTRTFRPVEPKDGEELNRQVAPKGKLDPPPPRGPA